VLVYVHDAEKENISPKGVIMEKDTREFEDFLQEVHGEQYVGTDDMMPDDYEEWLQDLDVDRWILLGMRFALKMQGKTLDKLQKSIIK